MLQDITLSYAMCRVLLPGTNCCKAAQNIINFERKGIHIIFTEYYQSLVSGRQGKYMKMVEGDDPYRPT